MRDEKIFPLACLVLRQILLVRSLSDWSDLRATHLCRPEIQVSQRRQLDEFFCALARHLRECEAETLEVAERAGTEHLREISIC